MNARTALVASCPLGLRTLSGVSMEANQATLPRVTTGESAETRALVALAEAERLTRKIVRRLLALSAGWRDG